MSSKYEPALTTALTLTYLAAVPGTFSERSGRRPVSMKCLIAVDQGPQAKRAYGGSAVARLQGRARDDGRPGPHLGEPPTEEQLLSSTSTRRSTTPRAARMCTMSVMPIVVCALFVYAI